MSVGRVRLLLNHAARAVCAVRPGSQTPASRFLKCNERSNVVLASRGWSPFSTAVEDTQQTPEPKKNKQDPRAQAKIGSIGRKIPQQWIQLLSETGENLGTMHRVQAIKTMENKGLKLVLLNGNSDPPVYQLMSGKQIHEEQMKVREKQKAKPAAVQVKELTFSPGIASHDLATKLKQVESWLEKKHHVRIALRAGRRESADNLDKTLEQMVQQIEVMVGFVSNPKVKEGSRTATCVIRPASAKEIAQKKKDKAAAPPLPAESGSRTSQSSTSSVSSTDTTEGAVQQ